MRLCLLVLAILCYFKVSTTVQAVPVPLEEKEAAQELLKMDPELLAAMEIFMGMDTEERKGVMEGLLEQASGNAERQAELKALFEMLPAMEAEQKHKSNLKQMVADDEFATAQAEARKQLDGTDWPSFWENQAEILEQVLMSGQLAPEDAARFKTDEDAWKAQLRIIWEDLQKVDGLGSDEL